MKTIVNRSKKPRTLARFLYEESGLYKYYFLTAKGTQRLKVVTTQYGTHPSDTIYGQHVRAGWLEGVFSFREIEVNPKWLIMMKPGESVRVPTLQTSRVS